MARGDKLRGKTYEEIHGFEKAQELRKQRRSIKHIVSEETREKQRISRRRYIEENPEKNYYNTTKATLGKTYEEIIGPERAKKRKEQIRDSVTKTKNTAEGKETIKRAVEKTKQWWSSLTPEEVQKMSREEGYESTRYGRRPDLDNQYFRSSWEANIARIFNLFNVSWKFEPGVFKLKIKKEVRYYRPDFYLPSLQYWVEVKGWGSLKKFKSFKKQYPSEKILLIDEKRYRELERIFKPLIRFWETGKSVETKRLTPKDAGEVIVRPAW